METKLLVTQKEIHELFYAPLDVGGNVKQDPKQGNQWQCDKCDWMPNIKREDVE